MVAGPGRRAVEPETDRIVAERIMEAVHEARIGPVEAEPGQLDAVEPLRRRRLAEPRPQGLDDRVAALGPQHVVGCRRQGGGFARPVVEREIDAS